jgi:hypothetical protein
MLLIISRNEDRPELESKILAAAFRQSVELGDIDGSRLAHRELVGLLARKAQARTADKIVDQIERVYASDAVPLDLQSFGSKKEAATSQYTFTPETGREPEPVSARVDASPVLREAEKIPKIGRKAAEEEVGSFYDVMLGNTDHVIVDQSGPKARPRAGSAFDLKADVASVQARVARPPALASSSPELQECEEPAVSTTDDRVDQTGNETAAEAGSAAAAPPEPASEPVKESLAMSLFREVQILPDVEVFGSSEAEAEPLHKRIVTEARESAPAVEQVLPEEEPAQSLFQVGDTDEEEPGEKAYAPDTYQEEPAPADLAVETYGDKPALSGTAGVENRDTEETAASVPETETDEEESVPVEPETETCEEEPVPVEPETETCEEEPVPVEPEAKTCEEEPVAPKTGVSARESEKQPALEEDDDDDTVIDPAAYLSAAWSRVGVEPVASLEHLEVGERVLPGPEDSGAMETRVARPTEELDTVKARVARTTDELDTVEARVVQPPAEETEISAAVDTEMIPTVEAVGSPAEFVDYNGQEYAEAARPEIYANIDFGQEESRPAESLPVQPVESIAAVLAQRSLPVPDSADYYSCIGAEATDPSFVLQVCYLRAVRQLLVRQFLSDRTKSLNIHDFRRQLKNMNIAINILFDPRTRLDYDLRQLGLREPARGKGLQIPADAKLPEAGGLVRLALSELLIASRVFDADQILAIVEASRLLPEQRFWLYLSRSGFLTAVEIDSIRTAFQFICNGLISIIQFEQAFQYTRKHQKQLLEVLLAVSWVRLVDLQQFVDSNDQNVLPEAPRFVEAATRKQEEASPVPLAGQTPDFVEWTAAAVSAPADQAPLVESVPGQEISAVDLTQPEVAETVEHPEMPYIEDLLSEVPVADAVEHEQPYVEDLQPEVPATSVVEDQLRYLDELEAEVAQEALEGLETPYVEDLQPEVPAADDVEDQLQYLDELESEVAQEALEESETQYVGELQSAPPEEEATGAATFVPLDFASLAIAAEAALEQAGGQTAADLEKAEPTPEEMPEESKMEVPPSLEAALSAAQELNLAESPLEDETETDDETSVAATQPEDGAAGGSSA